MDHVAGYAALVQEEASSVGVQVGAAGHAVEQAVQVGRGVREVRIHLDHRALDWPFNSGRRVKTDLAPDEGRVDRPTVFL